MDTELRKRLEEAAEQCAVQSLAYFAQHNQTPTHFDWADKVKDGFIAGAEHGYKGAIAQAKEWLLQYLPTPDWYSSTEEFVADFETNMNKLWEEQK